MKFKGEFGIAASLLVAAAGGPSISAFDSSSSNSPVGSRREMMQQAASAIISGASVLSVGTGFASPALAKDEKAPSVLRSAGCARGAGEACADLAEGNSFILDLQRKSQENAEQADAAALAAYNNKNFPEFMASLNPPKYLVKMPDGKFQVYDNVELSKLKAAGKIKVERPLAKGGKIGLDLTQKPILVLVD
mmetsp:Transcript_6616/g.14501  ORF Transcript_6616/g.14501 Transcript_6616/m.14501 type:complete len:192 (+) Transcript_6616:83-658(+)